MGLCLCISLWPMAMYSLSLMTELYRKKKEQICHLLGKSDKPLHNWPAKKYFGGVTSATYHWLLYTLFEQKLVIIYNYNSTFKHSLQCLFFFLRLMYHISNVAIHVTLCIYDTNIRKIHIYTQHQRNIIIIRSVIYWSCMTYLRVKRDTL